MTHPPAGDDRKPSIAAVSVCGQTDEQRVVTVSRDVCCVAQMVGSMDAHPSCYIATVRVQQHRQVRGGRRHEGRGGRGGCGYVEKGRERGAEDN